MPCFRLIQHPSARRGLLAALLLLAGAGCAPPGEVVPSEEEEYQGALDQLATATQWAGGPEVEVECLGQPYLGTWNPLGFLDPGAAGRFIFQVCGPAAVLDLGVATYVTENPVAMRIRDPDGKVTVLDTRGTGVALFQVPQPMLGTWTVETWNLGRRHTDYEVSLRVE